MEGSIAVRKGAWTKEEDTLLRQYIERHGEGKWKQVPPGTGLNRCRKSCRMRWVNYLKPNIKRGGFAADEVDLMIKLHELLGNRWSLIAGRIPGRTANDVKNYWSTNMRKKEISQMKNMKEKTQDIVKVRAIKPRPVKISKKLTWLPEKPTIAGNFRSEKNVNNIASTSMIPEKSMNWWEELSDLAESDERDVCSISQLDDESNKIIWDKQMIPETKVWDAFDEGGPSCVDVSMDNILWDLFHVE